MALKRKVPFRLHLRLSTHLSVLALTALPVWGEIVLIESRTYGTATGNVTLNPPYEEAAGSWSGSGSHTTAVGTTAGIGSRYAFASTPVLKLHPTLIAGASYALEVAHIIINASPTSL